MKSLSAFALLKVGLAWHRPNLGIRSSSVETGLLARRLADRSGGEPGDVVITRPILERLPPEYRGEFNPVEDRQSEEVQVYVRHGSRNADLNLSVDSKADTLWRTEF